MTAFLLLHIIGKRKERMEERKKDREERNKKK
jgi:hypothetical protein